MITSGRQNSPKHTSTPSASIRGARLTTVAGALIFTVFLCSSVANIPETQMTDSAFGDGAYQVFSTVDETPEEDASAVSDSSVWAYLESAIARLIYGER